MKIRITGTGNRARDHFISRAFDLSDPFWMNLAVRCWKENTSKFNKLDIIDAETGEDPVGDPDDVWKDLESFKRKVQ